VDQYHAGAISDLAQRYHAGAISDLAQRYHTGAPVAASESNDLYDALYEATY
jgi:hypothetical protein